MKLTLGFSPCPNDTYIFDALVNKKVDTGGFEFEVLLEDVQTLNQWAKEGKLDISKISYGVLPKIAQDYAVLHSGGALGKGVGPLLISKQLVVSSWQAMQQLVNNATIAIPGADTTAHFLFSQAFPQATHKLFKRFDEIENWVMAGEGLGVIIHENRFTYQQKGLHKLIDLGAHWEQTTGHPIPLGGIVIKRTIDPIIQKKIDHIIRQSLEYANAHHPFISDYVRCNAQEMNEEVMRQHIQLYVNDYSLQLGSKGKAAVWQMLDTLGGVAIGSHQIFVAD